MKTDYDYYLQGCHHQEIVPLSRWRFSVAYAQYRQMLKWDMDQWVRVEERQRGRIVTRWNRLRQLAALVRQGQDLVMAAARDDWSRGGEESGGAGAGVREPRIPIAPLLCGCAARSLPYPDPNAFVERQL